MTADMPRGSLLAPLAMSQSDEYARSHASAISFRDMPDASQMAMRSFHSFVMAEESTGFRNNPQGHSVTAFRCNRAMTIGARVKEARTEAGLTVRQLYQKTGLAESTIYDLERGDSKSTTKLHLIADATGVLTQWLETGKLPKKGGGSNLEVVPVAQSMEMAYVDKVVGGSLSAGMGEVLWDFEQIDKSHAFRLDWMQAKGLRAERCKVWTVRGDSMDPKYPHGSWVLINMAERQPTHGKNFALIGEDGVRLKQLRRAGGGGWEMHSLNADKDKYPPEPIVEDNYAIIGRVRGHGGDDD